MRIVNKIFEIMFEKYFENDKDVGYFYKEELYYICIYWFILKYNKFFLGNKVLELDFWIFIIWLV